MERWSGGLCGAAPGGSEMKDECMDECVRLTWVWAERDALNPGLELV